MYSHRACSRRVGYRLLRAAPASQHPSRQSAIRNSITSQRRATQSSEVIHLGNLCLDVVLEVRTRQTRALWHL